MNIENRLKKRDFCEFAKYNPSSIVKMWVLPKGALCRLMEIDGVSILQNGSNSVCRSSIVDAMAEHGIRGLIVVDSTSNNAPTIPRWIQYYFTGKTYEDLCNNPHELVVTTLGKCDIKEGLPFIVKSTSYIELPASEVSRATRMLSQNDPTVDLFLIESENGTCYQYEPQRSAEGVIVAYTEKGYVVSLHNGETVQIVDRVNLRTRNALNRYKISPKDMVGSSVRIQYTSFMGAGRIKPYKAAMICCIYSIIRMLREDRDYDFNEVPKSTDFIFNVSKSEMSAIITPTKLVESNAVLCDDGIRFYDNFNGQLIASLICGKSEGRPTIVADRGYGEECFVFETCYDNDSFMYKSMITVVGRMLRERYNFKVIRTGLYYVKNGVEMLSNGKLNLNQENVSNGFTEAF